MGSEVEMKKQKELTKWHPVAEESPRSGFGWCWGVMKGRKTEWLGDMETESSACLKAIDEANKRNGVRQ